MAESGNELVKELTKVMTEIGLDIREIKTTLSHFGEKFDGVHQEINDVKSDTKDNVKEIEKLKIKMNTVEIQSLETKEDVEVLFRKNKDRDLKGDVDRKWLIGTIIAVAGLLVAVVGIVIKFT